MAGPTASAWQDLDVLCGTVIGNGQTSEWFTKSLREIVDAHHWNGWGDRPTFARRARVLYQTILAIDYAATRLGQLKDGNFELWVYSASDPFSDCHKDHSVMHGLVVPAAHEFWDVWYPPNNYVCRCSVFGAHNEKGAARLGGDVKRTMPDWWDDPRRGPHRSFVGFIGPNLREIVRASLSDEAM